MKNNNIFSIKLFLLVVACLTSLPECFAQKLKGTVVSESGEAVPYATVRLKSPSSTGTITNLDGYFELGLKDGSTDDSLLISHIGEGSYSNIVQKALNQEVFKLTNSSIALSEVVISPQNFSAKDTVQKAMDNYATNHWGSEVELSAFYREYGAQNGKWGRFFEADITLNNFGSLQLNDQMKIAVNQARKSVDGYENTKDKTNPFFILYRPLKFKLAEQQYEYIGLDNLDEKLVYVIRFYNNGADGDYEGELFLDAESLAFLEIRAKMSEQGKNKVQQKGWGKIDGKLSHFKYYRRKNDIIVKFKEYRGKNLLSAIVIDNIWTAEAKNNKVIYNTSSNFLVTGIKEEFKPIADAQAIEKMADLLAKDYSYNEAFWQNYTYLIADKKQQEILSQLKPVR